MGMTQHHDTAVTAGDLISRAVGLLAEWEYTPAEGDPMIDVLLGVISETLSLLRALPAAPASAGVTVKPSACDTDSCDGLPEVYFVRGNVGSHYCGRCYLKIHGMEQSRLSALSQPAQGGEGGAV